MGVAMWGGAQRPGPHVALFGTPPRRRGAPGGRIHGRRAPLGTPASLKMMEASSWGNGSVHSAPITGAARRRAI